MRKYETQEVTQERAILTEVRCDKCNQLLHHQSPTSQKSKRSEHSLQEEAAIPRKLLPAQFKYDGQYGSDFDGQEWLSELCENCAIQVFDFINNDLGQGVQIEELSPASYPDHEYLNEYQQAPFNPDKQEYIGRMTCLYHPHLGALKLIKSGLHCSQPGCSVHEDWIAKQDLVKL